LLQVLLQARMALQQLTLFHVQALFQKSIVTSICMRVAASSRTQGCAPPMTVTEASILEQHLSNIEAASTDALLQAAEDVIAVHALSAPGLDDRLRTALSAGSAALQIEAAELLRNVQALLVYGRCEGFECMPGECAALERPPQWAQALLLEPARLSLHGKVGRVAHQLARVAAVTEAVHEPFLSRLF
jgi:hypothetical protein